ncbi:DEAD/DEAH box helicase [Shewanella intestini]|uniref:DEAD/DEAH box helicase n=1 Tax=Shewanella intestini TaxID=2017544 RepID=A0ABS5HZJ3_9GAMM|nr:MULTISPECIES: DEAD/DEAH box helicase [Shewanella]MBR9726455.1 DEAD/DEAH box helicase [Shewanella intestini]MRG34979.1 DEAD/DEAH box helicase [Shewanella sp. XMDDZSB0408]
MSFSNMSLHSQLLLQLPASIVTPTIIQQQAIPVILKGEDLLALAQTGSGKTLAFVLPILHKVMQRQLAMLEVKAAIVAVIIVPTRELALQVTTHITSIGQALNLKVEQLSGGENIEQQVSRLTEPAPIIVATPGRLLALAQQGEVNFEQLNMLVLDEADRLLDRGFVEDITALLTFMPARQTCLFSATMPEKLTHLATSVLANTAIRIEANKLNKVVGDIKQTIYHVNKGCKVNALKHLIKQYAWQQVLVFVNAKADADSVCKKLSKAGIATAALHGDKEQVKRSQMLSDFKSGKITVLIATDVLARGIHIDALPVVVNFELPLQAAVYIHRIGRTARAGKCGDAISLVCHQELLQLNTIVQLTQQPLVTQSLVAFPVTDQPRNNDSKRPVRDKQANRRTANKNSNKAFVKRAPRRK